MPHDDFHYVLYTVLSSPAFQQIAPLVFLILIPTLILFLNSHRHAISSAVLMVLESLAVILPWNWSDTSSTSSGSARKLRRKAHTRSRDDQVARTSSTGVLYPPLGVYFLTSISFTLSASHEGPNEGYYHGLVNISGTYCFMNSTMQVRRLSMSPIHTLISCPGHGVTSIPPATTRANSRQGRGPGRSHTCH